MVGTYNLFVYLKIGIIAASPKAIYTIIFCNVNGDIYDNNYQHDGPSPIPPTGVSSVAIKGVKIPPRATFWAIKEN